MKGFSGMHAWLIQRFTGIYIGIFSIILALAIWRADPSSYQQWSGLFARPWLQLGSSLFVVALLFHAWIGLRDVIIDYIHPVWIKMLIMTAVILMLVASGFWFLKALLLVEVIS
jgi:succinate dehydrogenase / fumarate reductase membrane anchor subunit